jgi:hypothetical protein
MTKFTFTAVSRHYFNLPIWIAQHCGLFEAEGLDRSYLHQAQQDVAALQASGA